MEGIFVLHKQIDGMPKNSQAKRLREACRRPPEYELFNLEQDPNELNNLYGKREALQSPATSYGNAFELAGVQQRSFPRL